MFCPQCGKEIPDNSKFCPECGASIASLEDDKTQNVETEVVGSEQKSALAAGLLGILLGSLGVHNFYLGYTMKAIVQLILGLTVVFSFISAIWGLIEGVMILTGNINVDGYGKPIKKDL